MAARIGIEIHRAERERHVELGCFQELQDWFDDANGGVTLAIQLHLLPGYLRVGAEARFPEIRSQHDDVVVAGLLLIRSEESAENRLHAEHRKQARRRLETEYAQRILIACEVHAVDVERGHGGERLAQAAII